MPDTIKDGKGRGYLAEVTSDNLLETNAVVETTYAWTSRKKSRAFVAASDTITPDGTDNDVFIMTNPSSSSNVVVRQVDISCTTNSIVTIKFKESYGSGGTGITPANLNRASVLPSVMSNDDVYYGDDLTLTGTPEIYSKFSTLANEPFREEILDALILGFDDSLAISINAASGSAFISVKYYEVDIEE